MSIRRVVPDIASARPDDSRKFYSEVLGFQVAMDMPLNEGRIITLVSSANPTAQLTILSGRTSTPPYGDPNLSIEVTDVDGVYGRVAAAGAEIVYPLTTEPWGVRRFFVADPSGVVINVMQHLS